MAPNDNKEPDKVQHWSVDKRVPVALIVTLLIQTGAAIWWGARIDSRVEFLERQNVVTAPHAERIIRLEEKVGTIKDGVDDIRMMLRRIPPDRRTEQQ